MAALQARSDASAHHRTGGEPVLRIALAASVALFAALALLVVAI